MKRITQRIFFAVCAALLVAIAYFLTGSETRDRAKAKESASAKEAMAGSGVATDYIGVSTGAGIRVKNKIPPAEGETLLDVYAFNLDLDEEDENILVVKRASDLEGKIRIVIADYVPSRRDWIRSWEGETASTQIKTFMVRAEDLIGDHNQTLVCMGMNQSNQQAIDVFWKDSAPDDQGLRFSSIFSIVADSIEIEQLDRTEGYELGAANGVSWPIVAYSSPPGAANPLDQVMTRYEWNFATLRYERSETMMIPGATIEQKKAASILTGDVRNFEGFLAGAWYRETAAPGDPEARMILFDPDARTVTFYWENRQEIFTWDASSPKRLGLYATVRNQTVASVRRFVNVELLSLDRVSMRIAQEIRIRADVEYPWNGTYRKLPAEYRASTVGSSSKGRYSEASFSIEGAWKSEGEALYSFQGKNFSITRGDRVESGYYVTYRFDGAAILQMIWLRSGARTQEKRTFTVETERDQKGNVIKLTLVPVRFTIEGIEKTDEDPLIITPSTVD
jgi:hypothetical protein